MSKRGTVDEELVVDDAYFQYVIVTTKKFSGMIQRKVKEAFG